METTIQYDMQVLLMTLRVCEVYAVTTVSNQAFASVSDPRHLASLLNPMQSRWDNSHAFER
jgi:hypothetical protein